MRQAAPASSDQPTLSEVPGTELRQLQITFESFREFVVRYSPWLSDSCIFVETQEPLPVGDQVRLEIRLRDQPPLVLALGQVDWARPPAAGEDGPPGVALEITYLDPASARLIESIFRRYTGRQSAATGKAVTGVRDLGAGSRIGQDSAGEPAAPAEAARVEVPEDDVPVDDVPEDEAPMNLEQAVELEMPSELADLDVPELEVPAGPVELDAAAGEEASPARKTPAGQETTTAEVSDFGFGLVEQPASAIAAVPAEIRLPRARETPVAASAPTQHLAGAAVAAEAEASDASSRRRTVLLFLLAVVVIGLLLLWLSGTLASGAPPAGGETKTTELSRRPEGLGIATGRQSC